MSTKMFLKVKYDKNAYKYYKQKRNIQVMKNGIENKNLYKYL